MPKFASGLADTDLNSNGVGFLKPTPILTPEVVKPNDSSRKPSNDSGIVEEQQIEKLIESSSQHYTIISISFHHNRSIYWRRGNIEEDSSFLLLLLSAGQKI